MREEPTHDPTHAALTAATSAHAAAERALSKAQATRDECSDAYASDMSEKALAALRSADERVVNLRLQIEAHSKRLTRARQAHDSAVRARLEGLLAEARTRADAGAALRACGPILARFLELDRTAGPLFAELRGVLAAQREAVASARVMGAQIGAVTSDLYDLHIDDVRSFLGVLVGAERMAQGRGKDRLELLISPIGLEGRDEGEVLDMAAFNRTHNEARALVEGDR
jgi:hypothetical protein